MNKIFRAGVLLATSIAISYGAVAQLADGKCKFLGNIHAGTPSADFKNYWNQITPENSGKWGSVEASRNEMSWAALDNAYKYAKDNDFTFKQHTFVWGQQQPTWIDGLTVEEQRQEVEEWIKSYCERYPETDYIDVVNEPLHAVPTYAEALGGAGETGWDWIIWSFEQARMHCPNAKLILNDYNIISSDQNTTAYLEIIELLQARDLIDIIGEQGHFLETTPSATITRNLDRLHQTGLPIHISEYDVNLADDNAQRIKYEEQFPLLWRHPGVHGITLWGYREGMIWRTDAYLVRMNGSARPALQWLSEFVRNEKGGTFCDPVTGIHIPENEQRVYPNPILDGQFFVDLPKGQYAVRIRDMQGVVQQSLEARGGIPYPITLAAPAGMYLLEIDDGRQTHFQKLLVN